MKTKITSEWIKSGRRWAALALAVGLAFGTQAAEQKDFYLKDGDRVVFYGDSITEQQLYTTFVETFVVTRFPKLKVEFINSGVGGDRVTGGWAGPIDVRLPRDVLTHAPTVVTIMLAMNDAGYRPFEQALFDTYRKGYEHILATLQAGLPAARLTLIQTSPFDDVTSEPNFPGGYNAVLLRYNAAVAEMAQEHGLQLVDFNAPVVAALEKAKAEDPKLAKQAIGDRVHPGEAAHLVMALALLDGWKAPRVVTEVELDAATGRVVKADGATITDVRAAGGLSWTEVDRALPLPLKFDDALTALIVRAGGVMAFDQETLRVAGGSAPAYRLTIDGRAIGTFERAELEKGINLAARGTPMTEQAAAVHELTKNHTWVHMNRWQHIQIALADSKSEAVKKALPPLLAAVDEEEAAMVAEQRAKAQPVSRHYELIPVAAGVQHE
ncbi:MAG TPA: SGNH/GDSL hydrolase family protein [Candidatus Didemnitutus sp.]